MKISNVTENPFRILGVYSNSQIKDIVSNKNRIKAFTKVNKVVQFPCDLIDDLGPVNRAEQDVIKAESSINLPQDKLRYALFWFCKLPGIDDISISHIINGDMAKAQEIIEKGRSGSNLVNSAVLDLINGDLNSAAQAYGNLIYGDESRKNDFVRLVCGDNFSISVKDFAKMLVDELLKSFSVSDIAEAFRDDFDAINVYLDEKTIEKIEKEIANAQDFDGNEEEVGKHLIQEVNDLIDEFESMETYYSQRMLAVREVIAKLLIKLSNQCSETETKQEFLEYSLDIAVNELTQDECASKLKSIKEQEQTVLIGIQSFLIKVALDGALASDRSFGSIETMLNLCTSPLKEIKEITDGGETYITISSTVANVAINILIEIFNQKSNVTADNVSKALSLLRNKIMPLSVDQKTKGRISDNLKILKETDDACKTAIANQQQQSQSQGNGCLASIIGWGVLGLICMLLFK